MSKDPNSTAEPTLAQQARTLMRVGGFSTLSTISLKHPEYPFGSVMPYADDDAGSPLFLISQMAVHTKNLRAQTRATLLVAASSGSLGSARISVMGDVAKVEGDAIQEVAQTYLSRHPDSRQWAGFGDFGFYRMTVKDVYFIGGFGVMGWINAEDYRAADSNA